MKILVADDDPVARKVLGSFLTQSNYETLIVADGQSAFRALTAPDAPHVAIIDWVMPDLSGPDLCIKVRKHNLIVQPYLMMLTSRKEKNDIVVALDAGADDFVSKPFNIQETQARLRVAERCLKRQFDLRRQIVELQEALRIERMTPGARLAKSLGGLESKTATVEARQMGFAALEQHQIDTVVDSVFRAAGQSHAARRVPEGAPEAQPAAWASLLLLNEGVWLDLLLEINPNERAAFFHQLRHQEATGESEIREFCAKVHTALRDSFQTVLRGMGTEVQPPLPARALSPGDAPDESFQEDFVQRYHYQSGGVTITLTIKAEACPLRGKTTEQLQLGDVLAKPYPPADTQCVPLLRSGVILTETVINKLELFTHGADDQLPPVLVHTPSALALHYHQLGSGAVHAS